MTARIVQTAPLSGQAASALPTHNVQSPLLQTADLLVSFVVRLYILCCRVRH